MAVAGFDNFGDELFEVSLGLVKGVLAFVDLNGWHPPDVARCRTARVRCPIPER